MEFKYLFFIFLYIVIVYSKGWKMRCYNKSGAVIATHCYDDEVTCHSKGEYYCESEEKISGAALYGCSISYDC